jgi:hypothetical protein
MTVHVIARLGPILYYGGLVGVGLSLFFLEAFAQGSIGTFHVAMGLAFASWLIGFACRLLTERFGATYEGGMIVLNSFVASIVAMIGVFLIANGIQLGGGAAHPNWFGQECWDATCYHPELIALGAVALGGGYFLLRSVPLVPPD